MSAQILDGRQLSQTIKDQLRGEVAKQKQETGHVPRLINIIIGNDPGSCAYANSQKKVADHIGLNYELETLPQDIDQSALIDLIRKLNADESVNGIMIHKPVPKHIDYGEVANYVDTIKDLEGINVTNIGKMIVGDTNIIPCTPASVMAHVQSIGMDLRGKEAVIVGHSTIVGKPLALLLLKEYVTVTVCHIGTSEAGRLIDHVKRADILIVAVGKAGLIKGEWIKDGAVVIDVGINRHDGKIVGDVDYDSAQERAAYITPVPGGVGPVTVTMLMKNGIEAFKAQIKRKEKV